jgi:F420-dependent oxidoreductase-like protein
LAIEDGRVGQMLLRVMTEPQEGATYDDLLRVARATEELGFDAFFRSDHLQRIADGDPGPGPTEAWVTLAGLARETSRIRLGTMVSSATFRPPGMLALTVATVDAMSGGRIEVGLGSGWFETEHRSFGIDFPPVAERFDVLTEQLEVLTGLWGAGAGTTYSFSGRHQVLTDNPALPRPVQQPHPPVIVGGKGKRRTPELAARFADEYNVPFDTPEVVAACFDRARAACTAAGRDPATLVLSAAQTLAVGRDDAEVRRRADAIQADPDELRAGGLGGTVAEVVDKIGRLADLGATRVYLQALDLTDLEHLELVAAEVAPQL